MNTDNSITYFGKLEFVYDAFGTKMRKTSTILEPNGQPKNTSWAVQITDYMGEYEYSNKVLSRIHNTEGSCVRQSNGAFLYEYTLKDHLGNTRVTFSNNNGDMSIDPNTEVSQINHYTPFGLNMEGNWNGQGGANKYQYNGKEWNDDFGLGWNDYGARFYDPAMARWVTVDPLAESYNHWSPYNYGMDSPIVNIDPDGRSAMPGRETSETEDYNNRPTVSDLVNKARATGHWSADGSAKEPTIEEVIAEGKRISPAFAALYANAGKVNIRFSKKSTGTVVKNITLLASTNIKLLIIKLTHELTNAINNEQISSLLEQVAKGDITSDAFATGWAEIEVEGQINQIKVASEIDFSYKENGMSEKNDEIVKRYKENPKSTDLSKEITASSAHLEEYKREGKRMRKEQIEYEKKLKQHEKDMKEWNRQNNPKVIIKGRRN